MKPASNGMNWKTLGFERNKNFFESCINEGRLGHAYVFSGQEMIGKRTLAAELAIQLTGSGNSAIKPDVLMIDSSSSESGEIIPIEAIRKIRSFVSTSSYGGRRKVVLIDETQRMTSESQNALLKVLEEPAPSVVYFLITSNPSLIKQTILSRCQIIYFNPHKIDVYIKALKDKTLTRDQINFLFRFSNGRIGLVSNIIRDDSLEEIKKNAEELSSIIKSNLNKRLASAAKLAKDRELLKQKVLYWILYLNTKSDFEPKRYSILKSLLFLHNTLRQPQFNTPVGT